MGDNWRESLKWASKRKIRLRTAILNEIYRNDYTDRRGQDLSIIHVGKEPDGKLKNTLGSDDYKCCFDDLMMFNTADWIIIEIKI